MRRLLTILPAFAYMAAALAGTADIVTFTDLRRALSDSANIGKTFAITGSVSLCCLPQHKNWMIRLSNEDNNSASIYGRDRATAAGVRLCDVIAASGHISFLDDTKPHAVCTAVEVLTNRFDEIGRPISADALFDDSNRFKVVRLRGIVHDCFRDESDPDWLYLALCCDRRWINAIVFAEAGTPVDYSAFLGQEVEIVGEIASATSTQRKHAGKILIANGLSQLEILSPSADAFDVPELDVVRAAAQPEELQFLGLRRVRGRVRAVWSKNNILVKAEDGSLVTAIVDVPNLPPFDAEIEVIGLPGTNYYHLQLDHARWRNAGTSFGERESPAPVSARQLMTDSRHQPQIDIRVHGRAVRIEGTVQHVPGGDISQNSSAYIESDGYLIPVDASCLPQVLDGIEVGYEVAVSGICIIECSSWTPTHLIPKAQGIRIAVRSPDDIVILSRPSWWTPARFAVVLAVLLAILVATLVWNASLRVMVARKSRALLRAQAAKLEETLKIGERTRLAAELHDYLAQNLTVISYQVSAALDALCHSRKDTELCLKMADKMLLSCRTDLRRCLWDLKSDALNEPDFAKAIERTSAPVAGDAKLHVRFGINRTRLNDTTAHTILSICRELVSNAVRHGKAARIRISGELKDDAVRFAVHDDGIGFTVSERPHCAGGHFGLDGIRERTRHFNGYIQIESAPGKGTRVVVTLRPKEGIS